MWRYTCVETKQTVLESAEEGAESTRELSTPRASGVERFGKTHLVPIAEIRVIKRRRCAIMRDNFALSPVYLR
jgi:hypothetical protein